MSLTDIRTVPSFEASGVTMEEDAVSYFTALTDIRCIFERETWLKMIPYKKYVTQLIEDKVHFTNRNSVTYHRLQTRELMLQSQEVLVDLCLDFMRRFHGVA